MLCAEELVARWGQPMREAPPELQRLDYPLPYGDLIRAEAARRNLDPRLVAAVMRQESRFEWAATSSAGAQGLMQLMPATAEWIASRLSWPGFQSQQAYWPYVNVAFGAYYLRLGLDQFDGSLAAALAGYNGGPGNAAAWRKDAGGDDDLMVALIPYDETRLYVQTIWAQYDAYRRLYPETGK
jgi:soluble lytic murein transglycosylase